MGWVHRLWGSLSRRLTGASPHAKVSRTIFRNETSKILLIFSKKIFLFFEMQVYVVTTDQSVEFINKKLKNVMHNYMGRYYRGVPGKLSVMVFNIFVCCILKHIIFLRLVSSPISSFLTNEWVLLRII